MHVLAPGTNIKAPYFEEAFEPVANLDLNKNWNIQKDAQQYQEAEPTDYTNVLAYDLDRQGLARPFFGVEFQTEAPIGALGGCYVEAYQSGHWEHVGGFSLQSMNAPSTKWFALAEDASKVRLIAAGISEDMTVHFSKVGYGASSGKYARLSGTSMSAPAVVAQYVFLKDTRPTEALTRLRARIISGSEAVAGDICVGGIVDADRSLTNPEPFITQATQDKNTLTLQGDFFGDQGEVLIEGKAAEQLSWTDERIVVKSPLSFEDYVPVTVRNVRFTRTQDILIKGEHGAWKSLAPLPQALNHATACAIADKVYLTGGTNAFEENNTKLYVYDIKQDRWETRTSPPQDSGEFQYAYGLSSTAIDGKMALWTFNPAVDENGFYLYDPTTDQWEKLPTQGGPEPRERAVLISFQNSLHLVGGIPKGESATTEVGQGLPIWRFDLRTRQWSKQDSLKEERFDAVVGIAGDKLVITGGKYGENKPLHTTEIFDGKQVKRGADLPVDGLMIGNAFPAPYGGLTLMTDGHSYKQKGFLYKDDKWQTREGRLGYARREAAASAFTDSGLYVFGGTVDNRLSDACSVLS